MNDLIARLEAAEVGSRDLDADAHGAVGTIFSRPITPEDRYYGHLYEPKNVSIFIPEALTPVTTSVDAALALAERVLPGWAWELYAAYEIKGVMRYGCNLGEEDTTYAHTPALALCCAVLKANAK